MTTQQLTRHILKDPVYRKWFRSNPPLLPVQRESNAPWWLYILKSWPNSSWSRAKVGNYKAAYKHVQKHINTVHDVVIVSRQRPYPPPVYRPVRDDGKRAARKKYWAKYPDSHYWCPYCRRPSIFRQYTNGHPAVNLSRQFTHPRPTHRCNVCGIREEAVKEWLTLGKK